MQKNDKSYTFLLSHSSRSKIYIRRVAVSKSKVHFGTVAVFLFIGISLFGLGISGIVKNTVYAQNLTTIKSLSTSTLTANNDNDTINYSRPSSPNELAVNSGGPGDDDEQDGESADLESQLKELQTGSNPAYLPTV